MDGTLVTERLKRVLESASQALSLDALRRVPLLDVASVSLRDILAEQKKSLVVHTRRDALRFAERRAAADDDASTHAAHHHEDGERRRASVAPEPTAIDVDDAIFTPVVRVPPGEAAACKVMWIDDHSGQTVTEAMMNAVMACAVNETAALLRLASSILATGDDDDDEGQKKKPREEHLLSSFPGVLGIGAGYVTAIDRRAQQQQQAQAAASTGGLPGGVCDSSDYESVVTVEHAPRLAVIIALSFCRAAPLHKLFSDGGVRGLRRPFIRSTAQQLAVLLSAVHRAGIIYRDLKLPNVLVDADGVVHLVDFGSSVLLGSNPAGADVVDPEGVAAAPWSAAAAMAATAHVRAPEATAGGDDATPGARTANPQGPAGDAFALGNLLFELGYGEAAFGGFEAGELRALSSAATGADVECALTFPAPPVIPRAEAVALGGARIDRDERTLKSAITDLLAFDPQQRLGCSGPSQPVDWAAVRAHAFLSPDDDQKQKKSSCSTSGQGVVVVAASEWQALLEEAFEASAPYAEEVDMQLLGL